MRIDGRPAVLGNQHRHVLPTTIYEMAGFDEQTAVWLSGFTALAQVVGIAVSIFLVDRSGRRTLVLSSLAFVTLSLAGLAGSFYLARITSILRDIYNPPIKGRISSFVFTTYYFRKKDKCVLFVYARVFCIVTCNV